MPYKIATYKTLKLVYTNVDIFITQIVLFELWNLVFLIWERPLMFALMLLLCCR